MAGLGVCGDKLLRQRARCGRVRGIRIARVSLWLIAALAALPASAGAASWSIQPSPNALTGSNMENHLFGVSCTSVSACKAVGWSADGNGPAFTTLAETWDGSSWSIQPTPNPAGGSSNPQPTLAAVSCTTASACTAVGDYYAVGGRATLAERWDGTNWSIQPTPNPGGASFLTGVSCASSNDCVAVGYYDSDSLYTVEPLIERWNGSTWTIDSVPTPSGSNAADLTGVSCTSASACTAVGHWFGQVEGLASAYLASPLVLTWNGQTWTAQQTLSPVSPLSASAGVSLNCSLRELISPCASVSSVTGFSGVSCTSANACTAVGDYWLVNQDLTLAERWDGTLWQTQLTPNPNVTRENYLNGVSCPSATACVAVGTNGRAYSGTTLPFGESWDGSQWSIESVPVPAGANNSELLGSSCTSATACTAVGDSYNPATQMSSTLIERYS